MALTNNLGITLLESSQAQKEITANEAFAKIDAILNRGAVDKDLNTPPSTPNAGDVYIISTSPTGAWAGHSKKIAYFDQIWRFITPNEGMTLWVNDENQQYSFDGTNWVKTISELQNLNMVGINATADSTNRLSVAADAVLFNKATNDMRVKINKQSSSDTASFVFQTNFSGRAEFGLTGADDFSLKVSSDGTAWNNSFSINRNNGEASVNQPFKLASYTVAGVPSATGRAGMMIYVSNGAAGNPVIAFSNGTNWLRVDNLSVIS